LFDVADHLAVEKTYFAPRPFADYFGKPIQTRWNMAAVMVPRIDLTVADIELTRMDHAAIHPTLDQYVFTFSDTSTPNWLVEALIPTASLKAQLRQQSESALLKLPWYTLAGNPLSRRLDEIAHFLAKRWGSREWTAVADTLASTP
jgi:hypothetical protein